MIDANTKLLSIDWKDVVVYDKESPTFLKWKHKRKCRNGKLANRGNNGVAGSITKDGYLSIGVNKSLFSIPKVVWVMHNGEIPEGFTIYFRDNNQLNADIENLYVREFNLPIKEKYSGVIREFLEYDPTSKSCLRWINKSSKSSKVTAGQEAGSLDEQDGYWKIHGLGYSYKGHRIVWFLHNGKIPEGFHVDHLNGNRSDNRIENLRVVPRVLNSRNRTLGKNNKTGHNMIQYKESFTRMGTPISAYIACLYKETFVRTSKSFSCTKYGKEKALEMAIKWRDTYLSELNSKGFGYTDRHGT